MTPADAEKERLLDAMEFSLSTLGWVGHMDEYEKICQVIRDMPPPTNVKGIVDSITKFWKKTHGEKP